SRKKGSISRRTRVSVSFVTFLSRKPVRSHPGTGTDDLVGFKVVRVDRNTGKSQDFIAHTKQTPDVTFDPSGMNKPIDVKFRGPTMFVVDFGVLEPGLNMMTPNSGKIWSVRAVSP